MDINKKRKIDYWAGIPICFLLSCLNYLQKALGIKKNKTKPDNNILFIKLSELGAIVLAYPLINRIKQEYPLAKLFFLTFDKNKSVFKLLGGIIPEENILTIRQKWPELILDVLKAVARLRKEKIDIVFDLEFFARISAVLSFLSGARKIIGFDRYGFEGLYRGNFLTHKLQYNPLIHVAKNYLSLGQVFRDSEKYTPQLDANIREEELCFPQYISDDNAKQSVLHKLKSLGIDKKQKNKLFVINPGEGVLPLREWPVDNFIALSKHILKDQDNYIIIIGTDNAAKKANLILKSLTGPRCISLVNQTKLDELLEVFSFADVLISNDCGLAHLAMLTQVKKFIIFGPENPRVFGPLGQNNWIMYSNWPCSPCLSVFNHRNSKCTENKCLKAITPEDVFNVLTECMEIRFEAIG